MSKYRAVPTFVDNIRFASKREAQRYQELKLLKVEELELQPEFSIVIRGTKVCVYRADFAYRGPGGERVIEDAKGIRTPVYRLKKKLVEAAYDVKIVEV